MANNNRESTKIILGMMAGIVVGLAAVYFTQQSRSRPTTTMGKIGRTVKEVGQMLEDRRLESFSDVVQGLEKNLSKENDIVRQLCHFLSSGMDLWHKIKKGG